MSWAACRAREWCTLMVLCGLVSCGSSSSPGAPSAPEDAGLDSVEPQDSSDSADGQGSADAPVDQGASEGGSTESGSAESGTAEEITSTCVTKTQDEAHCKDCCDCAPLACTDLTPCRDACKTHDFSQNTELIEVQAPSELGKDGDYSQCVENNTTEQTCKVCCECQMGLACGDFQYCRTLCDNSYGS